MTDKALTDCKAGVRNFRLSKTIIATNFINVLLYRTKTSLKFSPEKARVYVTRAKVKVGGDNSLQMYSHLEL